ncbi:MAG: fibronectin type III domain-containing protein [Flavobacteriales bacterium]|nr:fibronectin type III domain-containing protein [Flavobacteriales bacterium]
MKSNYATVKQGTKRLPYLELVSKGRNIVRLMTGNAHFPDPHPGLDVVADACDALAVATHVANFSRGRQDLLARDLAYDQLRALLRGMGGYVQSVSNGDASIIMSAGFDIKRTVQPSQELPAPQRVVAQRTQHPGVLVVRWGGVKNRKFYMVQVNEQDPEVASAWSTVAVTGNNQVRVEGLESARPYFFRVVAIGAKGESPVSDIALAKAA